MNERHRDILRRHWSSLRRDLEPIKLLPYLVNVLDVADVQEVKVKATREERIDKLLEILPRRGPTAFDDFVKALQEVQPFLAAPLLQESDIQQTAGDELQRNDARNTRSRTGNGDGNYGNTSGARFENITISGSNNNVNLGNKQKVKLYVNK